MKEQKLVDQKIIEKKNKKVYSPMRTLFKLTVNIKNSKNNSIERRRRKSTSLIESSDNNNYQLNKIRRIRNINNNYNSSIFTKSKKDNSLIDNKDNYYNSNFSNSIYDENMNNEKKDYIEYNINFNKNSNENNNYDNYEHNYKKINTNEINNRKNIKDNYLNKKNNNFQNNEKKKNNNLKTKKNEIKNDKNNNNNNNNTNNNTNRTKNSLSNISYGPIENFPENVNTSSGVFNYKINKKYKKNSNYNIINNNNNNNNSNKKNQKNVPKNNIQVIEMPYTNSDANYINNFNYITKCNSPSNTNNPNNKMKYTNINKDSNNNHYVNETMQPQDYYLKRYNLGNTNNIISPNQNIIFNIKKQNIKKVNNILINAKEVPNNAIYSPKRGLARVHSQENVVNKDKDIEQINSITENRIIYKNRSVKDLIGYTYTRKNNIQKTRNNINNPNIKNINNDNNNNIIDNSVKNNRFIKYLSNSYYNNYNNNDYENRNKFFNSNKNLLTKKEDPNYFDEKKYDIKPDIYPEIKINLRNRKNRPKNNSVIIENNRYNINTSNLDINSDNNISNKYSSKNLYNMQNKYKSIDENIFYNNNKNINNSFLTNINTHKSVICQNANISITGNTFSDIDLISNKNLTYKIQDEKYLTVKDMYHILILEEKIKELYDALKSDKKENMNNFCFDLINYYFYYSINNYIKNAIIDVIETNNIVIYNNYTIFALIIIYDLIFDDKNYKNMKLLIKEMVKLIYSNVILIINHSKNRINNSEENFSILYHIINNIQNKYTHNKELYIADSEYLLMEQNNNLTFEEKIDYNINFIIRNIHTIINNMKNTKNYNNYYNLFKNLININFEEINKFYRDKILIVNVINSTLLCNKILNKNANSNSNIKITLPYFTVPSKKKYSLVISLDDTLIHFKTGSIKNNKGIAQLRPGLIEFFEMIRPYYEIIIFSNGNKKYSDLIINSIDDKKKNYIDHRLYRDHCVIISNDFVKDISRIGRPLDKIVIVDNIPQNYRLQKENGINIKSFYGDNPNDKILFCLSKVLINIAKNGGDVRNGIKKYTNEIINKISSNIYSNYYCK